MDACKECRIRRTWCELTIDLNKSAGRGLSPPLQLSFLRLIAFRNGDIYYDPQNTDMHEDLIDARGLCDTDRLTGFVRADFMPDHIDDLVNVDKYRLIIHQEEEVFWVNDVRQTIEKKCRHQINRMIISDHRRILLGGCWIITAGANIQRIINGRIVYMNGGIVKYLAGGSISYYRAGLIKHWVDYEGNEIQTECCIR